MSKKSIITKDVLQYAQERFQEEGLDTNMLYQTFLDIAVSIIAMISVESEYETSEAVTDVLDEFNTNARRVTAQQEALRLFKQEKQ